MNIRIDFTLIITPTPDYALPYAVGRVELKPHPNAIITKVRDFSQHEDPAIHLSGEMLVVSDDLDPSGSNLTEWVRTQYDMIPEDCLEVNVHSAHFE